MIANLQIHQEVIYSWVLAMIKKIFGLEKNYNNLKNSKEECKERDIFGKFFDRMIKDYFGESFSQTLLEK
jgi:hypothetical protein